jgi:hypothetical protein
MLAWFAAGRDMPALEKLSDEKLLMAYCEGHVGALRMSETTASPAA